MKTSSRRTVQIPIVQPGGTGTVGAANEDRLIEVYTQLHTFDALTKQEEVETQAVDAKARDKDTKGGSADAVKAFLGDFKFGMTRKQVMQVVTREITERYKEQINATLDTYKQDNLRKKRDEGQGEHG